MTIKSMTIRLKTKGHTDILDITADVEENIASSGLKNGIVNVSVVGSTGAVTTVEYEPGLVKDLKGFFDKILPRGSYHHDQAWGDGNGHSHLRASLVGPSVSLPFSDGKMILGTWQQIIFLDFDIRARSRELIVQIVGE